MKHWLFTRANDRPPDWEKVTDNINISNNTIVWDGDNKEYVVPVNRELFPQQFAHLVKDWPTGQILRQFDKDITGLAVMHDNGDYLITQSFLPASLRNPTNTRKINFDLLEEALENREWVALALPLATPDNVVQHTLLENSRYIARDENCKLVYVDGNKEQLPEQTNTQVLTLFVAFRLGKSNGYVLVVNHDILCFHGNVTQMFQNRTFNCGPFHSTNNIIGFAFAPSFNSELIANSLIVEKDELLINIGKDAALMLRCSKCLQNIDFVVESSWEYEINGLTVKLKKKPGVGYVKILFDCKDYTKPYITAEHRKVKLEYILLGV